jgi:tRNA-dihydrouridine synthase
MQARSNNATAPGAAIAPGAEQIDAAQVARGWVVDARLVAVVPGFDAPFFQAGLAGYSDSAMRITARRHGCPYCVTEALLDRTLLSGGRGFAKADLGELADNVPGGDEDHPLCGQIMGSDPDEMAAAAVKMIEQGAKHPKHYQSLAQGRQGLAQGQKMAWVSEFDRGDGPLSLVVPEARTFASIDVNLACPVKKIRSKARGGHWLREPEGAIAILRAVREALPRSVPTTVKLRRGTDDSAEAERNFLRIYDAAYELGYAWATVHCRTVEQKYVGPSKWTFLRELVARTPERVVLGSGDVWSVHDIFRMLAYTGVKAVSVARGCIGNPWIFRQARQMMAGLPPSPPTLAEQRQVLRDHFALCVALHGEDLAARWMRKFGVRFAAHHPWPDEVRRRFIAVEGSADWLAVLEQWYDEESLERTVRELAPHSAAAPAAESDEAWDCG